MRVKDIMSAPAMEVFESESVQRAAELLIGVA